MLTDEQINDLLNASSVTCQDLLALDCCYNRLHIVFSGSVIPLSEAQKRLMICLINNITCKRTIIRIVWKDNHSRIRDNNYHQLVFQFRALLQRNGLPTDLLITVPYYGLILNKPLLQALSYEAERPSTPEKADEEKPQDSRKKLLPQLLSLARSLF